MVPTYEELASRNRDLDAELRLLAERNRTLEALLKAEQDRAVHDREQREALAEKHSFTERVLADLKKNYALLQQEHELLRRRVFEAKAERIDSKQLELELEKTKTELDAMREQIEHATGTKLDDETDSPKTRTRNRPTGRRRLDPASLPTEEIVVTAHVRPEHGPRADEAHVLRPKLTIAPSGRGETPNASPSSTYGAESHSPRASAWIA